MKSISYTTVEVILIIYACAGIIFVWLCFLKEKKEDSEVKRKRDAADKQELELLIKMSGGAKRKYMEDDNAYKERLQMKLGIPIAVAIEYKEGY